MSDTALYDAIFTRKSTRKYNMNPLDDDRLQSVFSRFDKLRNLTSQAPVTLRLLSQDEIGSRLAVKAPHFIAAWSRDDLASLLNVGFLLQQLDLHLSSNDLGSCYSGMAKPVKELQQLDGMGCRMLLAFGEAAEPVHRAGLDEFTRKPLDQISTPGLPEEIMRAVRLAPSGVNRQGWYFTGDEQRIHAYKNEKGGGIAGVFAKGLINIDMGIALAHLMLAAQHHGYACRFDLAANPNEDLPKGCHYACTAALEKKGVNKTS